MQCAVCGDKAYGCNFGAISCESCKSFYRRHAHKQVDFQCPSDGTCTINKLTRKYCPGCRMKKCFSVGMTRPFREAVCTNSATAVSSSTMSGQPLQRVVKVESAQDSSGTSQAVIDARDCSPTSSRSSREQQPAKIRLKRKIASTDEDREADACTTPSTSDTKQLHVRLQSEVCAPPASSYQSTFNDMKQGITEVLNSMDALYSMSEVKRRDPSPASVSRAVISYMETALRRSVRSLKRLPDFSALPQSTQIFSLRRNLLEHFQFFSILNVNEDNTGWVVRMEDPTMSMPTNFYEQFIQFGLEFNVDFRTYVYRYKKFVDDIRACFPSDWRFMTVLFSIMTTFSMKYESSAGSFDADVARATATYEKHLRFLETYLRMEYGAQSDAKFSFCLSILEQVREVAEMNAVTITRLLTGVPPPPPSMDEPPDAVQERATTTVAPLLAEAVLHQLDNPPAP